uniref:NAD(P)-binding domain-containing protein n=1 Tax=Compsopogon caeruleus TaxID=31354 RepID=A0A7S1TFN8_9RHOD
MDLGFVIPHSGTLGWVFGDGFSCRCGQWRGIRMEVSLPRVLVTGATGRTGQLVWKKLVGSGKWDPVGVVRSRERAEEVLGSESVSRVSFTSLTDPEGEETLRQAMQGCKALIILSSAMPIPKDLSKSPPEFGYIEGQMPEQVDWIGAKRCMDLAKRVSTVDHIVLVGSMGSTNPDHPLNKIGNGNILSWKRKAEEYLITQVDIPYTVINPGGLINEPGGQRELMVGKADMLLEMMGNQGSTIPREDVAEVVVQALDHSDSRNKAFDIISRPPGQGVPTKDFTALFRSTTPGL